MANHNYLYDVLNKIFDVLNLNQKYINTIIYEIEIKKSTHISLIFNRKTKNIITWSSNLTKPYNKNNKSYHAEIGTIIKFYYNSKFCYIKDDLDLLVFKINKCGIISNSKPCAQCIQTLNNFNEKINIKNIYYSINNEFLEKCELKNIKNDHISKGNR